MTIASEISRLQGAKADICTAIENKGVTVGNIRLDCYCDCINAIQTGSSIDTAVDVLVVGGGGSGGLAQNYSGVGGGGGAVVECSRYNLEGVSNVNVVVGSGGCNFNDGGDSGFCSICAGGGQSVGCNRSINNTFCVLKGNGAGGTQTVQGGWVATRFCKGYGGKYIGGNGCCYYGGGGGGAGGNGCNGCHLYCGTQWFDGGGNGGPGYLTNFGGTEEEFGGGGGGGCIPRALTANAGGYLCIGTTISGYGGKSGGNGGCGDCDAKYYGGGGGGGGYGNQPGKGYQGIVIVKYKKDGSYGDADFVGGDKVIYKDGYYIHRFTTNGGTFKKRTTEKVVDVLMVGGGGGGGGCFCGGGGGGGEVREFGPIELSVGNHSVIVGGGGAGLTQCSGCNGGDSCFEGCVVIGGGGGGKYGYSGCDGGNGGGGGAGTTCGGCGCNGGYNGGNSYVYYAGGGGGAGGTGGMGECYNDGTNHLKGGDGGNGLPSCMSGALVYYGGGGGGSGNSESRCGHGCDGGGDARYNSNGCNGTRGGGGGGGRCGGNGGDGLVIIRYRTDGSDGINCATGGIVYTCGDYTIHCFTSNGTFTVVS